MKEKIRETVISLGADLCGFANIDRFDKAPDGFKPTDIFPACKSVISFAITLPEGLAHISPRLIYGHYQEVMSVWHIDFITLSAAKQIERDFDCIAVPIPSNDPYEYWDAEKMEGRGLLSMKHLAVQAGLGTLGKNMLLLNQRHGNMLTLGAILTDLDLPSDMLADSICIDRCRKCVDNCPAQAIKDGTVTQKLCRNNTYGKTRREYDTVDCNKCRMICPMRKGEKR